MNHRTVLKLYTIKSYFLTNCLESTLKVFRLLKGHPIRSMMIVPKLRDKENVSLKDNNKGSFLEAEVKWETGTRELLHEVGFLQ